MYLNYFINIFNELKSVTNIFEIKFFTQPCDEAVYEFIDSNMLLVAGIALAIGLAEVRTLLIKTNKNDKLVI